MNQDGIVQIQIPADSVTDSASEKNTASNTKSVTYDMPLTVAVELYTGQFSNSSAPVQKSTSNASTLYYVVKFSEPVASFTASNITLSGTAAGMSVASVTPQGYQAGDDDAVGTWDYLVAVSGMTKDGTVILGVNPGAVADASGETNKSGATCSITWDATAPTVTIEQSSGQIDPVSGAADKVTIYFTATFSEAMDAETITGSVLNLTQLSGGTLGWSTIEVTSVSTKEYKFAVSGFGKGQSGTLVASINAGVCADKAGNLNKASTSTDNQITVQTSTLTSVVALAAGQSQNATGSSVSFKVTFSSAVSEFTKDNVDTAGSTAFISGATPEITVAPSDTAGKVYLVTISGMNQDGTVQIQIPEDSTTSTAGDSNDKSNTVSVNFTCDLTVAVALYDGRYSSNPTSQTEYSNDDTIYFVVSFSKPVSSFDASNLSFAGSEGTVTGMTAAVTPKAIRPTARISRHGITSSPSPA